MNNDKLNRFAPYIIAIFLFIFLSVTYFPDILQGKKLNQHDRKTYVGTSKEIKDFREKTDDNVLWTNSLFGGMPAYLVNNNISNNIMKYIQKYTNYSSVTRPANFIFFALFGFFIALLLFGVDPWLSIVGAFAFAFSTYFLIIIEAGHLAKVGAMAYMPPIIAGVHYAYVKDKLKGSLVVLIFLGLQLYINHLQITYYTLLIILIYLTFQAVKSIKEKKINQFFISSLFLLAAGLIAVSINFTNISTVYSYGKDSIRGESELSIDKKNQTSGLDKDYATDWSYGKLETLNLLIPNLAGGGSHGELSENSEMAKELEKLGARDVDKIVKSMPTYWGPQPFTSGPVYIGAIMIFLFVLGLFLVKGMIKWWLLAVTILSILLAWGKYFMPLTDFFLDYFPMYNKFRTVSMILVMAEFSIPFLGILAIKQIIDKKIEKKEMLKGLKWSLGIVTGIIIVLLINPGILSFTGENDAALFKQSFGLGDDAQSSNILRSLLSAIQEDRKTLFQNDALRSLGFILSSALFIWLLIIEKLKNTYVFIGLGFLILIDLWAVDKRFLNSDDFVAKRIQKEPFKPSVSDNFILKDKDPNYRVLNLTVSTFNDASTSYFHKSIGGYHGAKMRRYQDLITHVLNKEIAMLINGLNSSTTELQSRAVMMNLSALNMLNTRYVIINPQSIPLKNSYALGNAWFVNEIKEVANADEEIKAIQRFNSARTAVIDKRFKEQFFDFKKDSSATINLTFYSPDKLSYQTNTKKAQLAVFSEIYYEKGWQAFIDGKKVPYMRANYVLRAMKIPKGKHKIEFVFNPSVWNISTKIALIGSIIFILVILYIVYIEIKKFRKV